MRDRPAGVLLLTAALIGAGLWTWAYTQEGLTVTLVAVGWMIVAVAFNGVLMVRHR